MSLYPRENYLKKIRGFYHETDLIKVITGVRRCGKSSLMVTIAEEIVNGGIPKENIFYFDLDSRGYKHIKTVAQLEDLLTKCDEIEGIKYLFIDEVQNVEGFEEVINAFRGDGNYSIFITGSNSYLLSGELVTKLTGRYIEFEMRTLSFEEYIGMKKYYGKEMSANLTEELDKYIYNGGFPRTIFLDSDDDKRTYVDNVIEEIFEKDIKRRVKVNNVAALKKVQTYIINNFGATCSLNGILVELKKAGMEIKLETLNRYINILKDAKILYECNRFDMKSKQSISGEQKYYLADLGFYMATNTDNRINYGPALENIVFNYAASKGYAISIGRIGKLECDFILRGKNMNYAYVQVAMTIMASRETEDREYKPFEMIKDNYPKYLLTRNDLIQKRDGILHKNIPEMMAKGELF
ncbi:MAG: ATP-binding protein [Clostridia bacterium]|nr:ATP-binding protein [Clostridia bacterium]